MSLSDEIYKRLKQEEEKRKAAEKEVEELDREFLATKGVRFDDGPKSKSSFHGNCDHPSTMENGTATFFWIVAMIVGAIFQDRLIIWIVATALWLRFITRHSK